MSTRGSFFKMLPNLRINLSSSIRIRRCIIQCHRCCSESSLLQTDKDVEGLFLDSRVQSILKKMTGFDVAKLCRPIKGKIGSPKYRFLTDEQLRQTRREADAVARTKLQMPPFMKERKPIDHCIAKNPELQGYIDSNVVFTDLTPALRPRDRHITVREPNGILRRASWDERDRMLQIYFPVDGRILGPVRMFQEPQLQEILARHNYEYVLDRACWQFEPDDPEYLGVASMTYRHVDREGKHDILRSTRHFGPMAFYLVVSQNVENLLLDCLQRELLDDASHLVRLYQIVHPELCAIPTPDDALRDDLDLVADFIESNAKKNRDGLEMALATLREIHKQRSLLEDSHNTRTQVQ